MDGATIASTAAGVVFGGVISALVSYFFYRRGSRDLRETSDEIQQLVIVLARALEESGHIKATWVDGRPKGIVISAMGQTDPVHITSSAIAVVRREDESDALGEVHRSV